VVVRRLIFRFDCQRQGLDCPQMEVGEFFGVIAFPLQTVHVKTVGAMNQVDERKHEERRGPTRGMQAEHEHAG
jgi:hypothetical protein